MSLPYPSIRVGSGHAAVARRRLQALCEALRRAPGTVGSMAELFDGFLLRATKVAGRVTGTLVDIPHRIAWSGGVDAAAYGWPQAGLVVSPYFEVVARDSLLTETDLFSDALPDKLLNGAAVYNTSSFGLFTAFSVLGNTDRTPLNFITHADTVALYTTVAKAINGVGAWDMLGPGDMILNACTARSIAQSHGSAAGGVASIEPLTSLNGRLGLGLTETTVTARTGARLCGRYYLPTTPGDNPTAEAEQFRNIQKPWCMAIARHREPGVMQWLVATHTTAQNNQVTDFYGERGVYIGTFVVVNNPAVDTPGVYLMGDHHRRNLLDANVLRQPQFDADGNEWRENYHVPYDLTFIDDTTALVYGAFYVRRVSEPEGAAVAYYSADLIRVDTETGTVISLVALADGVENSHADMVFANSVGIGSPGDGTAVAVGCHGTAGDSWGVVRVAANGAVTKSYFAPGFVHYGNGVGQTIGAVEYIGNNKYAFPVSIAMGGPPDYVCDWSVAVYDAEADSLALAGTLEGPRALMVNNQWVSENLYVGRMCCVQAELADENGEITRHATVLATIGPYGLQATDKDNRAGRTYISYDSCQTWHLMINYGSPRGVVYGGNPAFVPEPRHLIRRAQP